MALRPESAGAHLNAGNVLKLTGDVEGASPSFAGLWSCNRILPWPTTILGLPSKIRATRGVRCAAYRRALELKPDFPEADNNLGNVIGVKGEPDAAIAEFRRAIELKPDFPEPHNSLGIALKGKGDVNGAITEYRQRWKSGPTIPRPTIILAMFFEVRATRTQPSRSTGVPSSLSLITRRPITIWAMHSGRRAISPARSPNTGSLCSSGPTFPKSTITSASP